MKLSEEQLDALDEDAFQSRAVGDNGARVYVVAVEAETLKELLGTYRALLKSTQELQAVIDRLVGKRTP